MASVNKVKAIYTHEGAKASRISPKQQLERSVMSCLLWENEAYEDGVSIVERIKDLVKQVDSKDVAEIAIKAKNDMRLRHVPLLLVRELFRNKNDRKLAGDTLLKVISRPDDVTEFLSLYWMDNKSEPLAKQAKVALGKAFNKFDEYSLAKYNGGNKAIKLVDALRIVHPEPSDLLGKLRRGELATPDTWEVELSKGTDKKASWERLLRESKIGGLAMLRNIRNMREAGIDNALIREGIAKINAGKLLPINFVSAAKHNPTFEAEIESKFLDCFNGQEKLSGKTVLIIDTSGSMGARLSAKSELERTDVAASLAAIAREKCEEVSIYCTAGDDSARKHATMQVPNRRGFALSSYITSSEVRSKIGGGGIFLVQVMNYVYDIEKTADRIIVLTDEQDCDHDKNPASANAFGVNNYLINIASNKNGIGYDKWTHINGWSDKVIEFIIANEKERPQGQN